MQIGYFHHFQPRYHHLFRNLFRNRIRNLPDCIHLMFPLVQKSGLSHHYLLRSPLREDFLLIPHISVKSTTNSKYVASSQLNQMVFIYIDLQ